MRLSMKYISTYEDQEALRVAVASALEDHPYSRVWTPDPSRHVVVKPNWVQEAHEYDAGSWEAVITHPALIEATVIETARRMGGVGTISICDAPHTYARLANILGRGDLLNRLERARREWPDVLIEVIDLRREVWVRKDGVVVSRKDNPPDPRGYVKYNLAHDSMFFGFRGEGRYYGADYDTDVVRSHHSGDVHEYLLSGTAVSCDMFINLPKLKTHKKTGITCCLKNLVGINGDKNWLPHHTEGPPSGGGDEYPDATALNRLEAVGTRFGRWLALRVPFVGPWTYARLRSAGQGILGTSETTIRNGNWYGNDTCWRMAIDLNRCLLFGNSDGTLRVAGKAKPYLGIIDGIVAGEGNGPISPSEIRAGVILVGDDPVALDALACATMGFDPSRLPLLRGGFDTAHPWPITSAELDALRVSDERSGGLMPLRDVPPVAGRAFRPHFGWVGHVERT